MRNDRKLALRKQSLRRLDGAELRAAAGGIILLIAPAATHWVAGTNWMIDTIAR